MATQTDLAQTFLKDQSEQFQIANLRKLEEDFYVLVNFAEVSVQKSKDNLDKLIKRFQMLPQSIKSQHQTDEKYVTIRHRILHSQTIKELFDNLTELKHWNYMTPDTLTYILCDVKNDALHQKIKEYQSKLKTFKETTKLSDIIGLHFPIPDYCVELTIKVNGWENMTIDDAEKAAKNLARKSSYRPWNRTLPVGSGAGCSGRDVLLVASDKSVTHLEAVARRMGKLMKEDVQKLQNQGVHHGCLDEIDIIKERLKLDRNFKIIDIKFGGSLSREDIIQNIVHLLSTTRNEGVVIYYVGAGRRNTGDWVFEDGFITFRELADIYVRNSNFRGRVLTIISDCSYSGCWVRDCMDFLDEQGVQPCGHKAREKNILIKVYASCQSIEIPTEYCYAVNGTNNDKDTGVMDFYLSKQLLETQKTDSVDSSTLHCKNEIINDICTLRSDYTWRNWRESKRIFLVRGEDSGIACWHYVLVEDNEHTIHKFKEHVVSGKVDLADYGQVLESGWGDDPPIRVKERINKKYNP